MWRKYVCIFFGQKVVENFSGTQSKYSPSYRSNYAQELKHDNNGWCNQLPLVQKLKHALNLYSWSSPFQDFCTIEKKKKDAKFEHFTYFRVHAVGLALVWFEAGLLCCFMKGTHYKKVELEHWQHMSGLSRVRCKSCQWSLLHFCFFKWEDNSMAVSINTKVHFKWFAQFNI